MAPELKTSEPLHVTEVTDDASGWYRIATDGHPKLLKTNREEGGSEAGRHKRDHTLIVIQYAERNDKPNPRGGFYHDYYWYSAKEAPEASTNGTSDDGITRVKTTRPETSSAEAWRISLSVGTERAVQLAPHLTENADLEFIWALAYEFAQRIFLTPPPPPDALALAGASTTTQGRGTYNEPGSDFGGTPVGDDDDIPFQPVL